MKCFFRKRMFLVVNNGFLFLLFGLLIAHQDFIVIGDCDSINKYHPRDAENIALVFWISKLALLYLCILYCFFVAVVIVTLESFIVQLLINVAIQDNEDDAKTAIHHFNGWSLAYGKKKIMATYRTTNYQKPNVKNLPPPPEPPQKRFKLYPKEPENPPSMEVRAEAAAGKVSEFAEEWTNYISQHPEDCSFQVVDWLQLYLKCGLFEWKCLAEVVHTLKKTKNTAFVYKGASSRRHRLMGVYVSCSWKRSWVVTSILVCHLVCLVLLLFYCLLGFTSD